MSRFGRDPRHSSGDLAYGDYYDRDGDSGGGRWTPERFTRERDRASRNRGPALVERDRYEEHDYYAPQPPRENRGGYRGPRRESSADGFYGRDRERDKESDRCPPFRFEERDNFGPPARRRESGRYYDEEVDSFDGSPARSGQMIPFDRRRQSINKDCAPSPRHAPPRPGIIRRQSSLDTFDRKPMPRYEPRRREPPETIVIPQSLRRRSPPRYPERERDTDFFQERPRDHFHDDDFHGYREREISIARRRRAESEARPAEFAEEKTFEIEEEEAEKPYPRKGKTKMPTRLGDTIIILKALAKEHIDEIIKVSKEMNERNASRTTYVIEAPPQPRPEAVDHRTEIIVSPPPPPDLPPSIRDWDDGHSTIKAGSVLGGQSTKGGHSVAGHKTLVREEPLEGGESNSMHGLQLVVPHRSKSHNRDERSIKAEIRALEAEKHRLKHEREEERRSHSHSHSRYREHDDGEVMIERERPDRSVKIEKDRK
ncbi:MAG: hypothetical protein Q9183_003256, partial [Haloplaca sp. 2 TL-2023]